PHNRRRPLVVERAKNLRPGRDACAPGRHGCVSFMGGRRRRDLPSSDGMNASSGDPMRPILSLKFLSLLLAILLTTSSFAQTNQPQKPRRLSSNPASAAVPSPRDVIGFTP